MLDWFKRISRDEDGAITVEWIVLTAAMVGIAVAMVTMTGDHLIAMEDKASTQISSLADQYY